MDYEMMMWDFWEKWHSVPHQCGLPSDNPLLHNLQCSYAGRADVHADFMTRCERISPKPNVWRKARTYWRE